MDSPPKPSGETASRFGEKLRYYSVRILLALGVTVLSLALATPLALKFLRPALLHYLLDNLSDARRSELYESLAARAGQFYDAVPEPAVGRLGKRGVVDSIPRRRSPDQQRGHAELHRLSGQAEGDLSDRLPGRLLRVRDRRTGGGPVLRPDRRVLPKPRYRGRRPRPSRPTPWGSTVGRCPRKRPTSPAGSPPTIRTSFCN